MGKRRGAHNYDTKFMEELIRKLSNLNIWWVRKIPHENQGKGRIHGLLNRKSRRRREGAHQYQAAMRKILSP
jgi:hypothetical protein